MTARIVWLASYPKSGNTWLRFLLDSLLRGGAPVDINHVRLPEAHAANRHLFRSILDVEASSFDPTTADTLRPVLYRHWVKDRQGLLFSKTHDRYRRVADGSPLFPADISHGVIHLIRDPRDVAVSLSHQLGLDLGRAADWVCSRPLERIGPSHDILYAQLPEVIGDWAGHSESWRETPLPRLVVRYEDLVTDPRASLGAVAGFLQLSPSRDILDAAIGQCRLERLQAQEQGDGFREASGVRFFRSGRIGQGRVTLSAQHLTRIEACLGPEMACHGYEGSGD
ncbi:MAG: sulfotransferase domain-containing protein [Rhodospirillaceae bacterium]